MGAVAAGVGEEDSGGDDGNADAEVGGGAVGGAADAEGPGTAAVGDVGDGCGMGAQPSTPTANEQAKIRKVGGPTASITGLRRK